jgi:hypothetical protein
LKKMSQLKQKGQLLNSFVVIWWALSMLSVKDINILLDKYLS